MLYRFVRVGLAFVLVFSLVPSAAFAEVLPGEPVDVLDTTTVKSDGIDSKPSETEGNSSDETGGSDGSAVGVDSDAIQDAANEEDNNVGGTANNAGNIESSDDVAIENDPSIIVQEEDDAVWDGKTVIVRSSQYQGVVLDCQAGKVAPGTNIQIYYSNHTPAQHFTLVANRDENGSFTGYYQVLRAETNMALAAVGTNVELVSGSAPVAQTTLWALSENTDGTVSFISKGSGEVIEVYANSVESGTNVWLSNSKNTAAQRFVLDEINLDEPQLIEEANYLISTALNPHVQSSFDVSARSGFLLDVSGGSSANGANVQIYFDNGTNAQRWRAVYLGDGYYRFESLASGKVLDCFAGGTTPGSNIQQYQYNETYAQQFKLIDAGNGYFYLSPECAPNLYVSVDGVAALSTNVCLSNNRATAQQFRFTRSYRGRTIADGTYQILTTLNTDYCLDVSGASKSAGANIQLYSFNYTAAQRFNFVYVQNREAYVIVNGASGMALTVAGAQAGANVYQDVITYADNQLWRISSDGGSGAYTIESISTGCLLDVNNASVASGTNIKVWTANGANAQRFYLDNKAIVAGSYLVYSKAYPGNVLSVGQNGATANGTSIEVSRANGSIAQKLWLQPQTGGGYEIRAWCSGKAFEPSQGSVASGTSVCTYDVSGGTTQSFVPQVTSDGYYRFVLVADSLKCLAVMANGRVVIQPIDDNNDAQKFDINPATSPYSGNSQLDWYLVDILNYIGRDNPDMLRAAFNYVAGFPYISGSLYPSGEWSIPYAIQMVQNHGGNCYRYASLMCWLARALGYDANVVSGYLPRRSGGIAPHGWVEVHKNGETYIIDADMVAAYPQRNWYFITYDSAPLTYNKF